MYLSPEMLGQNGVNKSADIYGIGLIIYEILTGKPAYFTTNPQELYSNIAHNRINFNEKGIKPVQKDLLQTIIDNSINQLQNSEKQLIKLTQEDIDTTEIARQTNLPVRSVRSMIAMAKNKIKKNILKQQS